MKLFLCLILFSSVSFAQTNLLVIGGGKRPVEAMKAFSEIAGKEKAEILIIPWASESIESAEAIKLELAAHTKGNLKIVPHRLAPKDLEILVSQIEKSSGIFFTGGNQNTLMTFIKDYQLTALFRKKFREGVIFGGTSAGTAIMSNPMLTGESDLTIIKGSQVELSEGLGLLPPHIIVDQHFVVRQRFNRLAGLILEKTGYTGIGIDENNAFLIRGNTGKMIGTTQVIIFQKNGSNKLNLTLLGPGQTFQL